MIYWKQSTTFSRKLTHGEIWSVNRSQKFPNSNLQLEKRKFNFCILSFSFKIFHFNTFWQQLGTKTNHIFDLFKIWCGKCSPTNLSIVYLLCGKTYWSCPCNIFTLIFSSLLLHFAMNKYNYFTVKLGYNEHSGTIKNVCSNRDSL